MYTVYFLKHNSPGIVVIGGIIGVVKWVLVGNVVRCSTEELNVGE
jgi:hypothetical protein